MSLFHVSIIEKLFSIVDRRGREVPYILWPHQKILAIRLAKTGLESGHLVLKAASMGISSFFLAIGMAEIMTKPDQTMVLLTHQEQLSELLLRRAKRFVRRVMEARDRLDIEFPSIIREPKEEIELSNGSLAYIGTAGSATDIGRGNPINVLICSEIAFYKDAGQLMRAILPRARHGLKIFESTANGTGGWFHHHCRTAMYGKGGYSFTFLPWMIHGEYTDDRKGRNPVKLNDKTEEELQIQEDAPHIVKQYVPEYLQLMGLDEFKLTDGQLRWRRKVIEELDDDANEGISGEEAWKQEYPGTPDEAFLRSGSPVFGQRCYHMIEKTLCEPQFIGDVA